MSLYREPGRNRKRTIGIALGALLAAFLVGLILGHSAQPTPSAKKLIERLDKDLEPARSGLELVQTEYPQSLRGTGAEAKAVTGDLKRVDDAIGKTRTDLEQLDKAGTLEFEAAVDRLETRIQARAPAPEVQQLAKDAQAKLGALPGGG